MSRCCKISREKYDDLKIKKKFAHLKLQSCLTIYLEINNYGVPSVKDEIACNLAEIACNLAKLQISCNLAKLQISCNLANLQISCNLAKLQITCNLAKLQISCNLAKLQISCNLAKLYAISAKSHAISSFTDGTP